MMAGRRRERGIDLPQRKTRHERRRAALNQRWAEAADHVARFEAVVGYVRGALRRRQPNPAWTAELTDQHSRELLALGDRLLGKQGREPLARKGTAA